MKLSEEMQLGHTLIGENRHFFYDDDDGCGCAIGSVYAAAGWKEGGLPDEYPGLGHQYISWLEERYPWTAAPVFGALKERCEERFEHVGTKEPISYAEAISILHFWGIPRMEIAQLIELDEPADSPPDCRDERSIESRKKRKETTNETQRSNAARPYSHHRMPRRILQR